ncbi:hypothetical protein [Primorskyibacter sp. S87]|uniref:hypothetical protein n=1 Tax=Primorskyibacter sp. S87 TaxID=3415126 RepID=UPI003C798AF6
MPNSFAFLMLFAWPLICVVLFKRLSTERAILWSILGGYLLLPQGAALDLPLVPDLDKVSIPNLSAFVICAFVARRKVELLPRAPVAKLLTVLYVLCAIPTVLTNGDPLIFQVIANSDPILYIVPAQPGLSLRDLFSFISNQAILLLPLLLARQYLSTEEGMRELLVAIMLGGLFYSLPALFEIRFSPQLHTWIYGFFQHSFDQMMRSGGFRPIVFLPHALWLAFFFLNAILATATLARVAEREERTRLFAAVIYLFVVLILCKSLASLLYGLVFLPVILFASPRQQISVAVCCATLAVAYPILRNTGMIPLDWILEQANAISPDRAQSLGYRFTNEDALLARADEKPLFGWGGWSRNLIRHEETRQILTIPDGRWIIVFGTLGWTGYIAEMGLLATPIAMMALQMRKMSNSEISPFVAPISILLAATMVDMLLNATLVPLTWMCAGAVLGYVERQRYPAKASKSNKIFSDGSVMQPNRDKSGSRSIL